MSEWKVQQHGDDGSYIYCDAFPCDAWVAVTGSKRREVAETIVKAVNAALAAHPAAADADAERPSVGERVESLREVLKDVEVHTDDDDAERLRSEVEQLKEDNAFAWGVVDSLKRKLGEE